MDQNLSHATRVAQLLALYCTLNFLTTVTIGLRFYTRLHIARFVGADDWWILAAFLVNLINLGLCLAYLHYGNAHHIWDVPEANLSPFFLLLYLIQLTYFISMAMIKMSCLSLYLRVFPSENFRLLVRCTMTFIVAMTLGIVLSGIFQCKSVDSDWDLSKFGHRKCINRLAQQYAASALSFTTDIFILILPVKYLINLPIARKARLQVILLMSLGSFTCIASIIRFRYIVYVAVSSDSTWDGYYLSLWTSIEFCLGMITTSLPAIKPLWSKYVNLYCKKQVEIPSTQHSREEVYYIAQQQMAATAHNAPSA